MPARAGALAAADEGVRRCARGPPSLKLRRAGGRAPQFLKTTGAGEAYFVMGRTIFSLRFGGERLCCSRSLNPAAG
jgi:hypothetical protein